MRHHSGTTRASGILLLALAPVLAACTSADDGADDAARELLFSPGPTDEAASTPASTDDVAVGLPPFPEDCTGLVATSDVVAIVAAPLPGDTTFVFADALPDIGRTARVTCGYGTSTGESAEPVVEITVNEYETDEAAQERIDLTLQAVAEGGNSVTEQPVGSYDGWIIGDGEDVSLVVDAGVRTLVVNVDRGLVSEDAEPVVLDRLASEALGLPTATVEPPAP